jgi:DNA-directed RNA polymerase specialized sigma24 family protein
LSNDALSDAALVAAILADHAGAKELAWLRFLPTVRRILRRFGSRFMDHDDVTQEIFLTFFRKLGKHDLIRLVRRALDLPERCR